MPHFNFDKVRFEMAAVTLKMRSRSNSWYVAKGLVQGDHLDITKQTYLYKPSEIWPILVPIGIHVKLNFGL